MSKFKVGVMGLGLMGRTHLHAYAKRDDVEVAAVYDPNPERFKLPSKSVGNLDGGEQGNFSIEGARKYTRWDELIADDELNFVDICLPTLFHVETATAAIRRGKPVLLEKPVARTAREAFSVAEAAESEGVLAMPAMCLRFWPGWAWLKEAIDSGRYGKLQALTIRRVGACPGGRFYLNGKLSGGALLDLHLHDADFIQYCLGLPKSVRSRGYTRMSGAIDHAFTQYEYDDFPIVTAEGQWHLNNGWHFLAEYQATFERCYAVFNSNAADRLQIFCHGEKAGKPVELPSGDGYDGEIAHFIDCLREGKAPTVTTMRQSAVSNAIIEAEEQSIGDNGKRVGLEFLKSRLRTAEG